MTRWVRSVVLLLLSCVVIAAQATPITRFARFTGNYNYVTTGGSLRTETNAGNSCAVGTTSTQALSGIPAGATIVAAYLYWGGSGGTVDSSVSLNGGTVLADRTFTTVPTITGTTYFGGSADITSRVSGNASFTFGNLTVDTGNAYCGNSSVMAGWAMVVVYENSSQPLRAINIFDGLDWFQNSSLTLTPDGFRIPASSIDGQMTNITWEGDPDLGGASETLSFNGSTLEAQGYDSISRFAAGSPGTTTNGVDVDTYDVSSRMAPGQTSATTFYSAGQDLVFLAAQIISVTSEPQVDLSITKTHTGNFSVGSNASYTIRVANAAGVQQVDYLTTVSDTLPAGLTFVSGTGAGWTCGASGQNVTCTHAAPLAAGSAFPDITLTVAVGNAAYPSVSNTATVVTAGSNDYTAGNNTATDVATVNGSNLSSSTKTVSDLNGGEANPGDTLRYAITLVNSSSVAATGVAVSDPLPGNTTNMTVVSFPSGASNTSTASQVTINNISVPANSSVTIVFDVSIIAGTSPGATISNTASVNNPGGVSATPSAPQVVVSPSLVPGSGTKQLYLWNSTVRLYRTPPTTVQAATTITGAGASSTWVMSPSLQKNLTLRGGSGLTGNFNVYLLIANSGSNTGSQRNVTVALMNGATTLATVSQAVAATGTPTLRSFTLNLPTTTTLTAGTTLSLVVTNNAASNRSITVTPYDGTGLSRVELNSLTVINVDSVQSYNAAYSGGVVTSSYVRGTTAYVRAVVSDPFGSYDISSAGITLKNPAGVAVVTNAAMTQVADSGTATKTYEYSYSVPANAPAGVWTTEVVAREGTENTITDLGVGTFTVTIPLPTLQVTKLSEIISDPVNNTTNPKRIPGSLIRYTITVTNTGPGAVDASTLVMTDVVPANTTLCIAAACGGVVEFVDGSPASGLSFNYASNVSYSDTAGGVAPFNHAATPDANGFDAAITGIRVAPSGTLAAAGVGNPGFSIRFYVKVN